MQNVETQTGNHLINSIDIDYYYYHYCCCCSRGYLQFGGFRLSTVFQ